MKLFRRRRPRRPVVIIGVDGLPFSLARRLAGNVTDGKTANRTQKTGQASLPVSPAGLPAFRRLFTEGMAVAGTSSVPPVSCTAWTSAASGRNPARHGVFGFLELKHGSYEGFIPMAPHVRCSRLWNATAAAGLRAVVLGVPVTYPPERFPGLHVSGFLAPDLAKAVHPPDRLAPLARAGYTLDVDPRIGHQDKRALLAAIRKTLAARADVILACLAAEKPDLLFAHIIETDRLNHFLFDAIETGQGDLAAEALDVYRQVDDLLGHLADALEGAPLIVCSDHGFCTVRKLVQVNDVLAGIGWAAWGEGKTHADISPDARAFSLDPGRVYIHTSSRYPRGPIADADRDRLAERLRDELAQAMIDSETGEPVFEAIHTRHDVFSGPLIGLAPDLVIIPRRGYDLKGALPGMGSSQPGALSGMHTYDDAFFGVLGCRITVEQSNVMDLAPSVLHLLGIEPEPDTDGRVILSAD